MKYLKQFLIIIIISFMGELFKYVLPFPVPASIYGMLILFAGLLSGLIPLDAVKDAGKFLLDIMPVMFIPAGVGIMASWENLLPLLFPISVITMVTLITVMAATGRMSQYIIRREKKNQDKKGKAHD